ncbi:hypothetical protein L5515_013854 [Caenorhabditis briggsae]|uniref:Uncharacterized protein n=1 Tax=Caenorhabditis briggsae TaxID=6238 RepID=A0AAE9EBI1_CAEBR|nr:hypothetical protein L5515_013854 [Caenorhabditis briggsae]
MSETKQLKLNRFILAAFLLVAIFAVSLASVAQQKVKNGDRFELRLFNGALAISRTVPAEKQVFNFIGEHKGYFVDENGRSSRPTTKFKTAFSSSRSLPMLMLDYTSSTQM